LGLRATTLCSQGDNIGAADNEDTLVLDEFAIPYKEGTAMDIDDLALTAFATVLLDVVFVPDLRSVAIGSNSVLIPAHDLRHLGVQECSHIALLVNNLQDFAINTDNATNR
jgi:hypothetical protein